ncbi:hypothetical protein GQ53DRAFT_817949 [Thozetella sp. PMI_491]|nr:hypothetical protein GQ53DRAFT_817949 [Thozetella sp. PMI_491]
MGLLCTTAFAITDHKSQRKQFLTPSFISYFLQTKVSAAEARRRGRASRAESWEGLYLLREPARGDFLGNILNNGMRDALYRPQRLRVEKMERFERDHMNERRFQGWKSIPESALSTEAVDDVDSSDRPGAAGPVLRGATRKKPNEYPCITTTRC